MATPSIKIIPIDKTILKSMKTEIDSYIKRYTGERQNRTKLTNI